jgi:hypothetical protein
MSEKKLTPEQQAFLKECELEFADRYSEKDSEYTDTRNAGDFDPPIHSPWEDGRRNEDGKRHADRHRHHSDSKVRRTSR